MSTINVTNLSGRGGATPNLPDGANITGVATATSFDGNLKSTGTPTLGLGVTINASGVAISGVATAGILSATTLYGDGSNLTGVGESIAPWRYNPDVNDAEVGSQTGIGITFNKKIYAGSGTATIKMVNAVSGVAGTTIQSWGISSATISNITDITLGALVSPLTINKTYQLDIPEGFILDGAAANYAGTAYTFSIQPAEYKLFAWGGGGSGQLGQNSDADFSSPVQIPSDGWRTIEGGSAFVAATKDDGTLWVWGEGNNGNLAQNSRADYSSPVQVPGTTWSTVRGCGVGQVLATKTDGTLWAWGSNQLGELGHSNDTYMSSPVQVPGTTWPKTDDQQLGAIAEHTLAVKTDGTLWVFGKNYNGHLGQNNIVSYSSPVQIPGTTWAKVPKNGVAQSFGIKTDGTLWAWGDNGFGALGLNSPNPSDVSSPTQIPGTTWSSIDGTTAGEGIFGVKTDGTAWGWGRNEYGQLGLNNRTYYSSPVQIPGTSWSKIYGALNGAYALKTDNTIWAWGRGANGSLGLNQLDYNLSSPVQIGSDAGWSDITPVNYAGVALQLDETP